MARQHKVFPTGEIPHKWAHAAQAHARNPQGNLHFTGNVISSYRTPIAQIYKKKNGDKLVLVSEHRYSLTTSGHLSDIRRAVSHLTAIEVPYPCIGRYGAGTHTADGAHKLNLEFLLKSAASELEKAGRALYRLPRAYRQKVAGNARATYRPGRARAGYYASMARRTDWRLGDGYPDRDGPVMLRLNGEEIETSQGARIPAAAAPMVWELVQRAIAQGGREFKAGLSRVKVGDYPIDEVRADGTLIAGCHQIPHSELRSMARQIGIAS